LLVVFSSVLFVSARDVYDWNLDGGSGLWTNSTAWDIPGYPNSTSVEARVDLGFSTGTVDVISSVFVSKLVIGPGCGTVRIIEPTSGGLVRLTVETDPMDTSAVTITGSIINQPITISVGDPSVTGRSVFVTVSTELGGEVKTFQLTRPSTTDGWFSGVFNTQQGPACPNQPTILCVTSPQDLTASYLAPLTGNTHNASFDIGCADLSAFTTDQVDWTLLVDSVTSNYNKLTDLLQRLQSIQLTLTSRDYAENIFYYKSIAQQSFLLGSTCFENYCSSTEELVHKLNVEGGEILEFEHTPLTRSHPEIQY